MKVFLLGLFLFVGFSFADSFWKPMQEALMLAKKDKRPIFVEYYADWCVPCQVMQANVFSDKAVQKKIEDNFYAVRLNVDSMDSVFCESKNVPIKECYTSVLKLQGIPSYVILDYSGVSLLSLSGAMGKEGMLRFLDKILYEGFQKNSKKKGVL
ncbi:MAG: thioredoxin family protein [Fibrobacteraceae bacterium]|nr:thioredoxin family protein [Fibrobacteraceae bacterium]